MAKRVARALKGFVENGRRYVCDDVHFTESADSFLHNDSMFYRVDHRGRSTFGHTATGGPFFLQPNATRYSEGFRCVYVRDEKTGDFWSAPYDPVQREPEKFEFAPGVADITWRNVTNGIETAMRVVIPAADALEVWTVTVKNVSSRRRAVSVYPFFPMGFLADLLNECWFDDKLGGIVYKYFPYYVKVEDYYKNSRLKNWVFCVPDRKPVSWEADLDTFKGGGLLHNPRQLSEPKLGRHICNFEDAVAAFQYAWTLAPGKSQTVNFVFGPARDLADARRLARKYLAKGGVDRAVKSIEKYHRDHAPQVRIETPDEEFNHYVNHWCPKQTLWIGRTLRSCFGPCARNAITDSMGITYNDPARAREWYLKIWAQQERGGWIKHGLEMAENVHVSMINTIPHRDMNVWGPHSLYTYVTETGDFSVLDEKVAFLDSPEKLPLYEHICIGLDWQLKDRTKRGLSRIGQGDWCDPLNMAGHKGRGESVMLTQNLAWALDIWASVAGYRGDKARARRYRKEADKCRDAVNRHGWDGAWYVRGFTDDGKAFGSKREKEGSIWLNPQGWAIITGTADDRRRKSAMAAVDKYLSTPSGLMMNGPAYHPFHEDIGKVTIKNPGIDENAAVYNSACAWYAYAMFAARLADQGWKHLRTILAGGFGNTLERSGQLPLYVPNFYKGLAVGPRAGESSHSPSTGTVSWFYYTAISMLMGVRGEFDGLRLDPQLPKAWKTARVQRRFRGADFNIEIKRGRVRKTTVTLDGAILPDNLIPLQKPGSKHKVEVTIP